jgi:dTDP-4-amino-4,6-dideoxygalactose transaminase
MSNLALLGGTPAVPPELRRARHPAALDDFEFRDLRPIAVLDYNGGGVIDDLEARFAQWHGRRHALATNSGTSALFSMFYAAGLREGDEVIVPVYTFFATATPLFRLGCRPVLVDCLDNGNIDPDEVGRRIGPRTKAVVVTHLWGIPCDMDPLVDVTRRAGIPLLEDASHAHGATYGGRLTGTFGLAAAWSLGARKLLTGGQGGVVATDDTGLHQRAILVGHYNRRGQRDVTLPELVPYAVTGTGMNLRMHPYSAALVAHQMDSFAQQLSDRRETGELVLRRLAELPGLHGYRVPAGAEPSYYALPIRYDASALGISRDLFLRALAAEGAVEVDAPGSTRPLIDFALFAESHAAAGDARAFERAAAYHRDVLKFPTWYGPRRIEIATAYVDAVRKVVAHAAELRAAPSRGAELAGGTP